MNFEIPGWLLTPWFHIGDTPIGGGRLFGLVVILTVVWWLASLLEHGIRRVALRGGRTDSQAIVYAWSRVVRYLVWIVGTVVGLSHIGIDLSNIALIGGALGVGIGFGLQNIFSNFISGVIILLERTLKVGDFVDLQSGVRGHVREIGLRYTRVTTNDAVDVIVPNSEFINGRVTNWTFENRYRRMRIPFGVAYGSDKEAVKAAALRAASKVSTTVEDETRKTDVWLVGFGDSSLDFMLVIWVGADAIARPSRTEAQYLWAISDELEASGIEIPFPQRDLHVRSGTLNVKLDRDPGGNDERGGKP
ncbi:MAG TPA: mechanosensitive ion channel domain-containing protein [Burkholderiales bacterium]